MIVSLEWLKDYTDVNVTPEEFCDRMIMSGSNLETMEHVGCDMENVVVGKIVKIEKHPDADKLVICRVDIGKEEPVQIVTGAPNVFEGAYVPVALDGSRIPGPLHGQPKQEGGVTIKAGKLRGVESEGMLCSFGELGFIDKVVPVDMRDGIWILGEEYPLGMDFAKALELDDYVIDFEITPNRPDCLSMVGMAREAAATFNEKVRHPETKCKNETGSAADYVSVDIRSDLCKRYVARIVKDVKVQPSPWWLQKRLIHAGMRPINNIVDVTNFVMLEYGQPIHAFDINSVAGQKIIVDTAYEGEKFTTLDGTERTLDETMLTIHDAEKSIAIAGVMGGLNSEIENDTKTIIVESANFLGNSVRTTAKKVGLRTEASSRYEKGIDPNLCGNAADRVCYLIELIGGGTVVGGSVDVYPEPEEPKKILGRVSRINSVLGIQIPREQMAGYLESLEMTVEGEGDEMYVTPPTVRQDIEIEEDIIEEVARLYGYDKLPVTIPKGSNEASQPYSRDVKDLARETMCALGCDEIQTYSFVSPKGVDNLRIGEDSWERGFVKIINPLGEDTSVMRTILMPGLLEVLGRNYSRNNEAVRAFEIGNTFMVNLLDEKDLPTESDAMSIGFYGDGEDFFTLKGAIVEMLGKLGIHDLEFIPEKEYGAFHPGRCARIAVRETVDGPDGPGEELTEIGIMGELHPDVADKYGIGTRCYAAELLFNIIIEMADLEKAYKPLPKYPAILRDISLVVDEDMAVGDIQKVIMAAGGDLLKSADLFDIYRGPQVGEGKKSVAFALVYRHDDKTLTDEEVDKIHEEILKALKEQLDVNLRDI